MSAPQPNMSTANQESNPGEHSHTPGTPLGAAQTAPISPTHPSSTTVVDNTSAPSASTTLLGAGQTGPPRPTSSSSREATLVSESKPVPEIPREHIAVTGSTPNQGDGRGRANTLPRKSVRVTRSYPTRDDAAHASRRIALPPDDLYRRSSARYPDSEMSWHLGDDREPSHEGNVRQRLGPTVIVANEELFKANQRAIWITWAQNIALTLEVLIGALTTALGAALTGDKTRIAISTLGISSTLVASYLARTRGSDEPSESRVRARELGHLLREVNSFVQDHGHEFGNKWDDRINDFRHSLERILGNSQRSPPTDPLSDAESNAGREYEKRAGSVDRAASLRENWKRPVSVKSATPEPMYV